MATVVKLLPYGDSFSVLFSDGSRLLAHEFNGVWRVPNNSNGLETIVKTVDVLILRFASGKIALAYPTVNMYIVTPNDEATPNDNFVWPFPADPWDTVPQDGGEFGDRSAWGLPYHNGIDFSVDAGSNIIAMGDGVVSYYQVWDGVTTTGLQALGNYLVIDHGGGLETGYAHMISPPFISSGSVSQYDVIGQVGNTGFSFGAHLHLETWESGVRINPRDWMATYA